MQFTEFHETGQPKGREAGVYVGLSMQDYHNDSAISSTGIKLINKDPAEYWWHSPLNPNREEKEETPAMKFGTAYHTRILEPEKFNYTIKRGVNSTKEKGMLGEGEIETILKMEAGLNMNPKHSALLRGGIPEVSIFWQDKETGLMCKIRCDMFHPQWICDLKTTNDISNKGLRYSFVDYGYEVSGAMYSIGAQALREMIKAGYNLPAPFTPEMQQAFMNESNQIFAFLFQAKDAPYQTRVWTVTPWLAEIGKAKFESGLNSYLNNIKNFGIETIWQSPHQDFEDITDGMLSNSINY